MFDSFLSSLIIVLIPWMAIIQIKDFSSRYSTPFSLQFSFKIWSLDGVGFFPPINQLTCLIRRQVYFVFEAMHLHAQFHNICSPYPVASEPGVWVNSEQAVGFARTRFLIWRNIFIFIEFAGRFTSCNKYQITMRPAALGQSSVYNGIFYLVFLSELQVSEQRNFWQIWT